MSFYNEVYPISNWATNENTSSDKNKDDTLSKDNFLDKHDLSNYYKITHRSFAPWKKFGGLLGKPFKGDDRGFSLGAHANRSTDRKVLFDGAVTSRICQRTYLELWNYPEIKYNFAESSETIGPVNFVGPNDSDFQEPFSKANMFQDVLELQFEAADPLITYPLAPDIDWHSKLIFSKTDKEDFITKKKSTFLEISGFSEGKNFPAFEIFITDKNDTSVFICTISSPTKDQIWELISNTYDIKREFEIQIEIDKESGLFGNIIWYGVKHYVQETVSDTPVAPVPKWAWFKTNLSKWNTSHLNKLAATDLKD